MLVCAATGLICCYLLRSTVRLLCNILLQFETVHVELLREAVQSSLDHVDLESVLCHLPSETLHVLRELVLFNALVRPLGLAHFQIGVLGFLSGRLGNSG